MHYKSTSTLCSLFFSSVPLFDESQSLPSSPPLSLSSPLSLSLVSIEALDVSSCYGIRFHSVCFLFNDRREERVSPEAKTALSAGLSKSFGAHYG
jgi:hypothetical protein